MRGCGAAVPSPGRTPTDHPHRRELKNTRSSRDGCSTGGPIKTLRLQRTPLRTAQISPRTCDNPIIRAMRGVLRVRDSRILRDQKEIREFLGTASRVHFSRGHLKKRTGTSVMRTRRRAPQPDARAHSRVRDGDASQLRIKPRARCFFRRLIDHMSTLVQGKVPMPESILKGEPPVNEDDDDDDDDDVSTRAREDPRLDPEPRASTSSRNVTAHHPPATSSTGATRAHAAAFRRGVRVPGGLFVTHQMRGVPTRSCFLSS